MPLSAIAADELRAARSAADKQGQNLAGVLPTLPPTEALAHLLSIFFAIFGDINDETTDALIKLSDVTTQIPFSAIARSDRFLRVDDRAFKQNPGASGPPAVHNYYMHVDFEAGNLANPRNWSARLGVLVVNLSPILKLGTRILHGLLNFGGQMYDCISHHLDSTSLLFAFRILQEQFHYVSQASVSSLWSKFHLLKYVPNTCMKTFVQEVKRIANSLHCDGRSLQPPRLGPGPRAVLQKLIDALIAIPDFNVEVARGQTIPEQAQVTLSELNRFFIVIADAARSKFPDVNNIVAAFFPLVPMTTGNWAPLRRTGTHGLPWLQVSCSTPTSTRLTGCSLQIWRTTS
jgi:hypothetical protein